MKVTVKNALEKLHGEQRLVTKTDVPSLDSLLGGGFSTGKVYELYGSPGAGKTQLALTLAAQTATSSFRRSNAVFFDAKAGFFPQRLAEILRARNSERLALKQAMAKVAVKRVFELGDLIGSLESVLGAAERDVFFSRLRLVVVDSIASLALPLLGEDADMRAVYRDMLRVRLLLRQVAQKLNVCVLVTNHDKKAGGSKPSLGRLFERAANVRLYMTRPGPGPQRLLRLEKSLLLLRLEGKKAEESGVNIGREGVMA